MVVGILAKKLLNFIKHNKGQYAAATAVVVVGIMVYISLQTTYYNLSQSQSKFYRENNFADYYFQVVKAPEAVTKQISSIPGVKRVTGRIQKDVPIFKTNQDRATARLVSYTLPMDDELNRITLEKGRSFAASQSGSSVEAVVDPKFGPANGISWGDTITVVVDGKERFVNIVGSANSPEFIYPMKDAADILPDPAKFGIFMLENRQAQQLLDMDGQINQVLIEFLPGSDQTRIVESVEDILKPYGMLTSYPRKYQLSHAVLQAKLDGIGSVALYIPAIFLLMAAVIQFIILRRMVKTQRTQIGVMKALGYNNSQIMMHYTLYALAVSSVGAVLGIALGNLMAGGISDLFSFYFNLPGGLKSFDLGTIINALTLSVGIGMVAGLTGSRGVLYIQPAEAMRPEPPRSSSRSWLEKWPALWGAFSPGWKMTLRNIGRNRGRFTVTVVGVMFAVSLLIIAFFYNDAVDYMMKKYFYQGETYDITVRFNSVVSEDELINISRLDGVRCVEAFMEVPVKIHFRGKGEDEILLAYPENMNMKKLQGENGQLIRVPGEGIIINQRTADKLGIIVGDQVEVETLMTTGPIHIETAYIAGVTQQLFGGGSYINLDQANRILGERHAATGAMIDVQADKIDEIQNQLDGMLGIASVLSRQKEIQIFQEEMSAVTGAMSIIIFFAVVLGFAIIYNASVINFSERRRELTTLRVMGFTLHEISALMLKENILLMVGGIILGLPFGKLMVKSYVESAATEQFTLPVIIYPATYLFSAIGGIIFVMVAHYFAVRGIRELDLVATMKNTD